LELGTSLLLGVEDALFLWVLVLPRIWVLNLSGIFEGTGKLSEESELSALLIPKVDFLLED
jgi:hypothetical protein